MPKTRIKYPKAPIIEALIDIQVRFQNELAESRLNGFADSLKEFPTKENVAVETAEILSSTDGIRVSSAREKVGYKLSSPKHSYVLQVRKTGFTFSILNRYDEWDTFSNEAKKYWEKYKRTLKPSKISRVAVRYINRIDVPESNFKFEEYFDTYPHVFKSNTKADVSGFFMQVQIPQKQGGMAIINQSPTAAPKPGYSSVILDIDVFDPQMFESKDKALWKRIEKLRDQKNYIFEKSITNKARELFK